MHKLKHVLHPTYSVFNPILILIGLTVAISAYAWSNHELMDSWILRPYAWPARQGQWYRLLTSGFLHADWGHLLFNMFAFYSFGARVSAPGTGARLEGFGQGRHLALFLLLYLGGIIVSDLPTYFRHRDDRGYRSLGASGGVASVLFASICCFPSITTVAASSFSIPLPIQPLHLRLPLPGLFLVPGPPPGRQHQPRCPLLRGCLWRGAALALMPAAAP